MESIPSEERNQTGGLKDFVAVLFKQKYKFLTIFVPTILVVTAGSFLLPPTYEAKSALLVKFGREYIYQPEVGERNSETRSVIPLTQEEVINSEIQILTSQDLMEKVITAIGIKDLYPDLLENPPKRGTPLGEAIRRFTKKLSIEGIKKSNVIQISFRHRNPQIAAKAVNLLTDFFKEKHLRVYTDNRSSFLEQQLLSFNRRLKKSQDRLEHFKQKNQVFSLDEQRSLLLRQYTDLDTSLKNTEHLVEALREKVAYLTREIQRIPENVQQQIETEPPKIIDDAKSNLLILQLKEQELLERYMDDNPQVSNVRRGIGFVEDFMGRHEDDLKRKITMARNVVYQDIERELIRSQSEQTAQEAKRAALRRQITEVLQNTQALDLKEKKLDDLKRELSTNERNYKAYLDKVEEARVSEDLNRRKMANISVIQVATIPEKPVRPRKALNILLAVVLGGISGLGLAFLSEHKGQQFSTPGSAERRLGVTVLATVPYQR